MIIEYDSDITAKPEYLTVDIYKNIIENALGIKLPEITKIECSMGSSTGENYCSQIYRSKIYYKNRASDMDVLPVIIKSITLSENADFLESLQVVSKEKSLYCDVLPRMEDLLSRKFRFGPRIYHSLTEPVNTLFFEDLSAIDYRLASREKGLDEVHARLTLKRLAYFHATSMVLAKSYPPIQQNFKSGMLAPAGLAKDDGMLMRFFGGCADALVTQVEKWPGYESIAQKLRNYVANLRKNLITSQAPSSYDTFEVLNHGDLWVNNMLFKYDCASKVPLDILFVDFQMSVWGSPGIDLNYFFYTSLQLDLLKHKTMVFLEYYHDELSTALKVMNYADTIPSFEQVKREFKNRAAYGFFANFAIFPAISMDKEISNDSNLENFANEDFAKQKIETMFQSKRLEETLKYTLKEFDKLGIWN